MSDLITVLETGDPGLIAIAKSILDEAEIDYVVLGEGIQDLFGAGRLGAGFNPLTGPVTMRVAGPDAETARALLTVLDEADDTR